MIILPKKVKDLKKKTRNGVPIRPSRSIKVAYYGELKKVVDLLRASNFILSDLDKENLSASDMSDEIERQIERVNDFVDMQAAQMAENFVNSSDAENKQRTETMIQRAFGIDFASIIDDPLLKDQLDLAVTTNVNLIKSIPQQHFSKVIQAVNDNYQGMKTQGMSLQERLRNIGKISNNRAKFIARDQTAKLASSINQLRQQNIGVTKYKWKNSQDERVVGNPSGLYPKGNRVHGNHWKRENKIYYYDRPPGDGPPGKAPNCRCVAEPQLDLDELEAQFV